MLPISILDFCKQKLSAPPMMSHAWGEQFLAHVGCIYDCSIVQQEQEREQEDHETVKTKRPPLWEGPKYLSY